MASFTTFATLKSELLATLGRAPSDVVYQLVTADINRDLRVADMEATATLTSGASYALPAAFLEMIDAYIAATPRRYLTPITPATLDRLYDSGNTEACQYAVVDGAILLDAADTSDVLIRYYTEATALSADDDDNVVFLKYPGVYWYGSLYHHARFQRDKAAAADWLADYTREMRLAQSSSAKARMAGGTMTVTPRVVA